MNNPNVRIVLLNAPPGSGKDTVANFDYSDRIPWQTCRVAFADRLKQMAVRFFCEHSRTAKVLRMYAFTDSIIQEWEKNKDTSLHYLNGQTPRQYYIAFAEKIIKPFFGQDYFGHVLKEDLERRVRYRDRTAKDPVIYLVSDAGFYEESKVLSDWAGIENVALVNIFKEDCYWNIDSRRLLTPSLLAGHCEGIVNNGTKEDLRQEFANCLVKMFLYTEVNHGINRINPRTTI